MSGPISNDSSHRGLAQGADSTGVTPPVVDTMTRQNVLGIVCVGLIAVFASSRPAHASQAAQEAASAAANASPELVGELSKELNATPEQAAGAAGALFGIAKSRLKPEEFSQISSVVPGMDSLLKAAPSPSSAVGINGWPGASGAGLAGAASAFTKLGLKPDMVSKAVPLLTSYVSKAAGPNVGNLLAGALK